jgi:hypothetical protein
MIELLVDVEEQTPNGAKAHEAVINLDYVVMREEIDRGHCRITLRADSVRGSNILIVKHTLNELSAKIVLMKRAEAALLYQTATVGDYG